MGSRIATDAAASYPKPRRSLLAKCQRTRESFGCTGIAPGPGKQSPSMGMITESTCYPARLLGVLQRLPRCALRRAPRRPAPIVSLSSDPVGDPPPQVPNRGGDPAVLFARGG